MKILSLILLFGAVPLALAGCADAPAITDTKDVRHTDLPVVSICYSERNSTQQDLFDLAFEHCPEGTAKIQVWQSDGILNNCPLSRKNRVTFQCLAQ